MLLNYRPCFLFQATYSSGTGGGDQVATLQNQVDEVKDVMNQNIDKVLQRGENLDELMDKTTDLEASVSTSTQDAIPQPNGVPAHLKNPKFGLNKSMRG